MGGVGRWTDRNHTKTHFQGPARSPLIPGGGKTDPQRSSLKLRGIDVEGKERIQTRTHLTTTYIQGF